jgi:phosphomannomutase
MSSTTPRNIFLFDVDGTLTPARQKMTEEFCSFFTEWIKNKTVYFISGSDYEKLQEQVPKDILESIDGVFGCMGNTLHIKGESAFKKTFSAPRELWDILEWELNNTTYRSTFGNHVEERIGMINFSTVGRNASLEERKNYYEWDKNTGERKHIADRINAEVDNIEAAVGGEISIDIYPKGWDKSQILEHIPIGAYHFFGDKTAPGGNDYALAKKLDKKKDFVYSINSYSDTERILRTL